MPPLIGVVDYGRGNLRSVAKALEAVGAQVRVSGKASRLAGAAGLLVPGVGAFGDAVGALKSRGLAPLIRRFHAEGRPLLGVCLGLQLFCRSSDEFGLHAGFGFFDAKVRRFGRGLKVPHMGWNQVAFEPGCPLFRGVRQGTHFYFLHSYRARLKAGAPGRAAQTRYGRETFDSGLCLGDLYAVQFHPEKSQSEGLKLYRNFWGIVRARHAGRGAVRLREAA